MEECSLTHPSVLGSALHLRWPRTSRRGKINAFASLVRAALKLDFDCQNNNVPVTGN